MNQRVLGGVRVQLALTAVRAALVGAAEEDANVMPTDVPASPALSVANVRLQLELTVRGGATDPRKALATPLPCLLILCVPNPQGHILIHLLEPHSLQAANQRFDCP